MPTIEVSEDTLNKIKEQLGDSFKTIDLNSLDDLIGHTWFFRAVTYHCMGNVKNIINGKWVVLEFASYIPCSARFMDFIKDGKHDEVEPVGDMYLNLDTVVDFFPWNHVLPTQQS